MHIRIRQIIFYAISICLLFFLIQGIVLFSSHLNDLIYGYYSAIGNSAFLATLYSLIINLASLLLAVFLIKIGCKKTHLSFLILPFFLGSVTASYSWKNVFFFQISFFTENQFYLTIGILIIQFWKIGFILTYFYFFIIQDEISKIGSYIKTYKITQGEVLRDFILPKVENPYIINSILIFVFTFFDSTISEKVFRVSRGQNNQLINDWLNSFYKISMHSDYYLAFKQLIIYSLLTMIVALLVIIMTTLIGKFIFNFYRKNIIFLEKKSIDKQREYPALFRFTVLVVLLISILYPVLKPITKYYIEINVIPYEIVKMVVLTLACALLVVLFSLFIHFKILIKSKFNRINNIRLAVLSFAFFLIPPVLIEKTSYELKSIFLFLDNTILWFILQLFWSLPLILLFSLPLVYSININSVKYDQVHKISILNSFNNNMLSVFNNSILLLFILVISIIWNDGIINSIFSDNLYSFASSFERVANGRVVDYQTANFMLALSLIISMVAILIYTRAEREIGLNNK